MKRVLISPLYGLGDVLMTFPAVEILKKNKPDWHITYVTFSKTVQSILSLNPYIDEVVYLPLTQVSKLKSAFLTVKHFFRKFDITINFFPSNRIDYNIFSFLTASSLRIGHRYQNMDISQLNFLKNLTILENPSLHCVEENINLIKLIGVGVDNIPSLSIYLDKSIIEETKVYLKDEKRLKIGIHPGSSKFKGHKNRRLPVEKFLNIIKHFPEADFYIFGSSEEQEEVYFLVNHTKNAIPIFDLDIITVASIIGNLDIFISNDSGLMHLASAMKRPVVAIFGPTNPVWVRPWNKPYKIVRLNLECSPCFVYSPKPLECSLETKFKCLRDIPEDMIVEAIKELLDETI